MPGLVLPELDSGGASQTHGCLYSGSLLPYPRFTPHIPHGLSTLRTLALHPGDTWGLTWEAVKTIGWEPL